jgi:NAD(P)-dependent dehydrogenase (short-subunit alcohol dehydrogenase family)
MFRKHIRNGGHFIFAFDEKPTTMQKQSKEKKLRKPQAQRKPGQEYKMKPEPVTETSYPGTGKLAGKVAFITGGDSGIGAAVAALFAKECASIAIAYLSEHKDAEDTKNIVEKYSECITIPGDLSNEQHCRDAVRQVIERYGKIDILVNNAAVHWEEENLEDLTTEHLLKTFATNVFSFFWITQEALPYMAEGSSIINTASVTAYRGSETLLDYASTKGAIVSFTRSLSSNLAKRGIRVNAVAPGPIWTPLIVSSYDKEKVSKFGSDVPLGRAGQPAEVAPSYLYLACDDSSFVTGQVLHVNGGEIING